MAIVAVPGSLVIVSLGARRAMVVGLLAIAVGPAARGAGPGMVTLSAMTVLMGVGVAVCQPVLPTLTGEWLPGQVARATAVYSNGLLVGATARPPSRVRWSARRSTAAGR